MNSKGKKRMIRGGSMSSDGHTVASRYSDGGLRKYRDVGFRVVLRLSNASQS